MKLLQRIKENMNTISRNRIRGIVILFALVYFVFFDAHNLLDRMKYARKLNHLEKELEHYQKELQAHERKLHELQSNDSNLVKYAREEYYMKRPNEDIYLIEEE